MGAILKRVGLGLLALWAVLWVLMTLLLLQDNPPSFRPQDVRNLLIVALAPWAATLLTAVLVRCWNKRLRDIRDSRGPQLRALPPVRSSGEHAVHRPEEKAG
jgi:hypothetical protein